MGVETLAVTEDRVEPVRRYFRVRPPRVRLATDTERSVHRAYGCPTPPFTGAYKELWATTRINPTGEAPEPMPVDVLQGWLKQHDRFGEIPEDRALIEQISPRDFKIHAGHFLIDRTGVVRWVRIETPIDDVSRYGQLPTDEELLTAARESLDAPG
jgi:hypothetical protein